MVENLNFGGGPYKVRLDIVIKSYTSKMKEIDRVFFLSTVITKTAFYTFLNSVTSDISLESLKREIEAISQVVEGEIDGRMGTISFQKGGKL